MPHDDNHRRDGAIVHRLERLRSLCRERGLSFTHQRAAVLSDLCGVCRRCAGGRSNPTGDQA